MGYDVYDLYDLGEFDQKGGRRTRYGTKEELLDTVRKATDLGIVTYVDAVLNHRYISHRPIPINIHLIKYRFGADEKEKFAATEVDNNDRTKEISGMYDIEVLFANHAFRILDAETRSHLLGMD